MNYYLITLENFAGKVNQCLIREICPDGFKKRNHSKVRRKKRNISKPFHQAGQKVVASFGRTVAFCQVIGKRSQEPASCP
jgi:hypothetical protein